MKVDFEDEMKMEDVPKQRLEVPEYQTELKAKIVHFVLNSLFLYFAELRNEKIRKDFEVLKNLISHFKILNFLVDEEAFKSNK